MNAKEAKAYLLKEEPRLKLMYEKTREAESKAGQLSDHFWLTSILADIQSTVYAGKKRTRSGRRLTDLAYEVKDLLSESALSTLAQEVENRLR